MNNTTTVATVPVTQYVWDLRYIDAPVLRFRNVSPPIANGSFDETVYYMQDANFNVTGLVSTAGIVVERVLYDAYGKHTLYDATWSTTQASTLYANEILYGGYRFDPESGMYQVRHRYYHSTLGRWVQRDSIGYSEGLNLYQYVRCNPLTRVDPSGQECASTCSTQQEPTAEDELFRKYNNSPIAWLKWWKRWLVGPPFTGPGGGPGIAPVPPAPPVAAPPAAPSGGGTTCYANFIDVAAAVHGTWRKDITDLTANNPQIWARGTAPGKGDGVKSITMSNVQRDAFVDGTLRRDKDQSIAAAALPTPALGAYVPPLPPHPILEMSWSYPGGWGTTVPPDTPGGSFWYQFRCDITCEYVSSSPKTVSLVIHITDQTPPKLVARPADDKLGGVLFEGETSTRKPKYEDQK